MTETGTADWLEEARAATTGELKALTDAELERGGLKAVRAFVRTRQSRAALRTIRHRQRQGAAGLRQMNIVAPDNEAARAVLKATADALTTGRLTPGDISALVGSQRPVPRRSAAPQAGKASAAPAAGATRSGPAAAVSQPDPLARDLARVRRVLENGGWRSALIRALVHVGARR